MLTTLKKWGNSQAVRLPKEILEKNHLKEGDLIEIRTENNTIILEPKKRKFKKISLELIFAGYSGEQPKEVWDEPVGEELW